MTTIGIDAARAFLATRTGTEVYAYEAIRNLIALAADVRFQLYVKRGAFVDASFRTANVTVHPLRWPLPVLWHQGRLSLELRRRAPDVFFTPAHTMPFLAPSRSVVTIHDIGFEDAPELYAPHELLYHRWAFRFSIKHAARVIAVSQFTKQQIIARFPAAARKIVVVHHGFTPDHAAASVSTETIERSLAALRVRQPYILFVGRLQTKKNTPRLVRAWTRFRQQGYRHALVLAGIPGTGYEEVRAAIAESPFHSDVVCTGYVSAAVKQHLYAGAAVFAFPSLYEGFGLPLLEAMAGRIPIVASHYAAIPEIAGDAAYYCDGEREESIAAALGRVVEDRPLRTMLIERGTVRVKQFSWQRCARETLQVLLAVAPADHP